MLSDVDIQEAIKERENDSKQGICIDPFEEKYLTPVGYDLRVGLKGFSWKNKRELNIETDLKITIESQDTVIIETLEEVSLSKKIGGTVHSMVSRVVPEGLSHISTTVDPGWTGKMLISIHNHLDTSVELEFKESFCTLCFYEIKTPADKDIRIAQDRDDLWKELKRKASREKEKEDNKKRLENLNRIFLIAALVFVACAVPIIIAIAFKNLALGQVIATIIGILVNSLLVLFLKPR